MNLIELIEKRKEVKGKLQDILTTGEKEERKLSIAELERIEELKEEIRNLDKQINELNNNTKNTKKMETKRFSLIQAIRDVAEGRGASDATLAMNELGQAEFRKSGISSKGHIVLPLEARAAIAAGSTNSGAEAIATEKWSLLEPLRNNLVLVKAGAKMLTGLVGNLSIPTYAGSTIGWVGETGNLGDAAGATGAVNLSPKRLGGYIDVSKQFLNQDSVDAEQMLINDLVAQLKVAIEQAAFTTSTSNGPNGLFYGITTTGQFDAYGAVDYSKCVSLRKKLQSGNALMGSIAWITHPEVEAKLLSTAKATNQAIFLMDENNRVLGYPVYTTASMGKVTISTVDYYGLILANWNDFVIGQWGGIDLIVDPYSQAVGGKVRIIVNAYFDFNVLRSASFAKGGITLS